MFCVKEEQMKYLRFGKIPKNGKSINFFKMTNDQNDNFSFCLDAYGIDQALEMVPDDVFEPGISVFEMDAEGLPILGTMRRMISLCARLNDPIYIVTGEKVGEGNDGEPLLSVSTAETIQIEREKLVSLILEELKKNFKSVVYDSQSDFRDNQIFDFHIGNKIEYCFNGWTFTDPVDGFDVSIGIKKE